MDKNASGAKRLRLFDNYKPLLVAALLLISFAASAQVRVGVRQKNNAKGFDFKEVAADSLLRLPKDTLPLLQKDSGSLAWKNNIVWVFDGVRWDTASGSGSGGGPIYQEGAGIDINGNVISVLPDTLKLSGALTLRVFGSDTTIALKGDLTTPGTNKVYGTDENGLWVWKPDPVNNISITQVPSYVIINNSLGLPDTMVSVNATNAGVVLPIDWSIWHAKVGQTQFLDSIATMRALALSGGGSGGGAETDPTVPGYVKSITNTNISNWNTAYGWGNHAGLYPTLAGSYANPSWITALDNSKITGLSTLLAGKSDVTHNHSLDALVNVNMTGKTTGDLIMWSGTAWVKKTPDWMTAAAGDLRWAMLAHSHSAADLTTGSIPALRYGAGTIPTSAFNVINGGVSNRILTYGNGWVDPPTGGVTDGDKGDITVSSAGSGWSVDAASITPAKLAVQANQTLIGNNAGSTTTPQILSVSTVRSMLSINNIDNTSDANKPVSTAQATAIGLKQDVLVSGTNIKTINGTSLLGSGNITISGGGGSYPSITDNGSLVTVAAPTSFTYGTADSIQLRNVGSGNTPDSLNGFGDSFTVGSGATTYDSSFLPKLGVYYNLPTHTYGVSGKGVVTATSESYRLLSPGHTALTSFMVGFNDLRRQTVVRATQNKILQGFKAAWINSIAKNIISPSSGSVTRSGTWNINWNAKAEGGKLTNSGAYTTVAGSYIDYTATDSTFYVALIAQDGSSGYEGSTFELYIDGVLKYSGTTDKQTDGVDDGFGNGNKRSQMAAYVTGLTYASHTFRILKTGSGFLIVDFLGSLQDKSIAKPFIGFHVPRMNATGYTIAPAGSSNTIVNATNVILDSLFATFPSGYPVKLAPSNTYYNTATDVNADNVHPNNAGHSHLRDAATFIMPTIGVNYLNKGSLIYLSGNYYGSKSGIKSKLAYESDMLSALDSITTNNHTTTLAFGSGTAGKIPKFSTSNVMANSIMTETTNRIGVAGQIASEGSSAGIILQNRNNSADDYNILASGPSLTWYSISRNRNLMLLDSTGNLTLPISTSTLTVGASSSSYRGFINGTFAANGQISTTGNAGGLVFHRRDNGNQSWNLYSPDGSLRWFDVNNGVDRFVFTSTGELNYQTDRSAGYTARSMTDKAYVDNAITTAIAGVGGGHTGSGTADYLARWTGTMALGVGATRDDGTNVGIGIAPGTYKLNVNGTIAAQGAFHSQGAASAYQVYRRDNNALSFSIFSSSGNLDFYDIAGTATRVYMTPSGLFKYTADMSGSYDDRTMVDKGFSKNASNLASGTVPTARLGSNTANSTTFLRGDQSWQPISSIGNSPYHAKQEASVITTTTSATTITSVNLPDNTAGLVTVWAIGVRQSNGDAYTYQFQIRYKKVAGTLTLGTHTNIQASEIDAGLSGSIISESVSSGNLVISVTPGNSNGIEWQATVAWIEKGLSL